MKICPVGAELLRAGGRTDMTTPPAPLHILAKASKNAIMYKYMCYEIQIMLKLKNDTR